jgi:molybdate transport system substrate-binding protein
VWTAVASKVIPLDNVRAARAAVEAGNVDAAVVYLTDVLPGRPLRVAFRVPAAEAPPVRYPAVALSGARAPARARAFVEYLAGPEARAVFARHGFGAAGAEPR